MDAAVQQIEKQFGKGASCSSATREAQNVEGIPTGSLSLDIALGGGGVPARPHHRDLRPRIQRQDDARPAHHRQRPESGGVAAFIDAEHALDPGWAKRLGVDLDDLLVSQPDTGEQALEIGELLVRSNAVDVIVIDSVAALIPRAEIEGEMGDSHVGLQARLMSQALRKLTGAISQAQTARHLHQPDPREDRRDVRQPRDDARRPGAEVLRLGPHRRPPDGTIKEGEDVDRQPHAGSGW